MQGSTNKQFVCFKFRSVILSSDGISRRPASYRPERAPSPRRVPTLRVRAAGRHAAAILVVKVSRCRGPVPLPSCILAPKGESSDAGNSNVPQRSPKALPLSGRMKVPQRRKEKKNRIPRLLRSTGRMNLLPAKP